MKLIDFLNKETPTYGGCMLCFATYYNNGEKQNIYSLKGSNQHLVICLSSTVDCFMIITMSGMAKQKIGKFYIRKKHDL